MPPFGVDFPIEPCAYCRHRRPLTDSQRVRPVRAKIEVMNAKTRKAIEMLREFGTAEISVGVAGTDVREETA